MADNLTCNVCDGNNFAVEDGFYFCSECQTQAQEIREQVYEMPETTGVTRFTKRKIHTEKSKNHSELTSWETYNHILAGLVKEFLALGANDELKEVSYNLWLKYLIELEIMSKTSEDTPKLGAVYRKKDAKIVFKKQYPKRKRSHSNSGVSTGSGELDRRSLGRIKAMEKRALMKAEYEQYSNTQSSGTSLLNKTLSTLSSDNETEEKPGVIKFSKAAKRELRKIMGTKHMEEHARDTDNLLKCHKINFALVSVNYVMGPRKITCNKLYSIIYISMLFTREKFQLSDMVRFCREGHLSYFEYKHMFPDTIDKSYIDDKLYQSGNKVLMTYKCIRKSACDIYKLLKFKPKDLSPNLMDLCQRYCKELNLPDHIFRIAGHLINNTKPKLLIKESSTHMPNYEARIMAFIIYALKVILSIDDVTECHLSKCANLINKKNDSNLDTTQPKMFVWDDWYTYINYRRVLLTNLHFPTKHLLQPDSINISDVFTKFSVNRKSLLEPNDDIPLSMTIAKKYLNDLILFENHDSTEHIEFKHSETPFRSNIEAILKSKQVKIAGYSIKHDILRDFAQDSVDYLVNYLPYLDTKCKIQLKTAHTNEKLRKIRFTKSDINTKNYLEKLEYKWHNAFKMQKIEMLHCDNISDRVLKKHIHNITNGIIVEPPKTRNIPFKPVVTKASLARDSKGRFCNSTTPDRKDASEFKPPRKRGDWFVAPGHRNLLLEEHKYNMPSLLNQVLKDVEVKEFMKEKRKRKRDAAFPNHDKKAQCDSDEYNVHYVPRCEYWVNVKNCIKMNVEQWNTFEKTLPCHFQWLLAECARVIEQTPRELFIEFVNVELYINYIYLKNVPVIEKGFDNYNELKKLIKIAANYW